MYWLFTLFEKILAVAGKFPRNVRIWRRQKNHALQIFWSVLTSALPNSDQKWEGRMTIHFVNR